MIKIDLTIVDDNSKEENLNKIKKLIESKKINTNIIRLDHVKYKKIIKNQNNDQTFSNLASLLLCYETAKEKAEDLVFFVEDDYLHFLPMMEEMIASYERISSQIKKDLFMCPSDYPFLYMNNQKLMF